MPPNFLAASADGSTAAPDTPGSSNFSAPSCGVGSGAMLNVYLGAFAPEASAATVATAVMPVIQAVRDCRDVGLAECVDKARYVKDARGLQRSPSRGLLRTASRGELRSRAGSGAPAPVTLGQPLGGVPRAVVGGRLEARSRAALSRSTSPSRRVASPLGSIGGGAIGGTVIARTGCSPTRQPHGPSRTAVAPHSGVAGQRTGSARVGGPYNLRQQLEVMGQQKVVLEWQLAEANKAQKALEAALGEERARGAVDREQMASLATRLDQLERSRAPIQVGMRGSEAAAAEGPSKVASDFQGQLEAQRSDLQELRRYFQEQQLRQLLPEHLRFSDSVLPPSLLSESTPVQQQACKLAALEFASHTSHCFHSATAGMSAAPSQPMPLVQRQVSSLSLDAAAGDDQARVRQELQDSRQMLARYTAELASIMPGIHRMLGELPQVPQNSVQAELPDVQQSSVAGAPFLRLMPSQVRSPDAASHRQTQFRDTSGMPHPAAVARPLGSQASGRCSGRGAGAVAGRRPSPLPSAPSTAAQGGRSRARSPAASARAAASRP